jgi:hypothetical protein
MSRAAKNVANQKLQKSNNLAIRTPGYIDIVAVDLRTIHF